MWKYFIYNVNETPVFFEMSSQTYVSKIGEISVNIINFGSDKTRKNIILYISSKEEKILP